MIYTQRAETIGIDAPAFSFSVHYELAVAGYKKVALSVPAIAQRESLQATDLLAAGEVAANGKFTLEQHLSHLLEQGMIELSRPLLVLGARNNLVNLRCLVVLAGQVHAVDGEEPQRSLRPYYGIGYRDNRFICDTLPGGGSGPEHWDFVAPGCRCFGTIGMKNGCSVSCYVKPPTAPTCSICPGETTPPPLTSAATLGKPCKPFLSNT